jgi:hypothetical protein
MNWKLISLNLAAFFFAFFAVKHCNSVSKTETSVVEKQLQEVVADLRKQLPIQIEMVTLYEIDLKGKTLTYRYQLPGLVKDYPLTAVFAMQEELFAAVCVSPLRESMRLGVEFVYDYRDEEKAEVIRVEINQKECLEKGF